MRDFSSVHLIITGRVQGVGFRFHTQRQAQVLGLTGWVRNLPNGGVEVMAEGDKTALENFIEWCRQGPPSARVDQIEVTWKAYEGKFKSFEILR